MTSISSAEEIELLQLLEQEDLERVSLKMERFREPWRIKLVKGGRGAGAKSWGAASLLIQRAHRYRLRIGCFREIQKSIEESSYELLVQTIRRLKYPGWKITNTYLESPTGSHIIFRGLSDIRAANQVKGLEDFNIFWLEEASAISHDSIRMLLPTLRNEGSELWVTYNQETEADPIDERLWNSDRDDVLRIWVEPGRTDNPWWTDELQGEMEADYRRDSDEAEHTWGGLPRQQGQRAVMNRAKIRGAMDLVLQPGKPIEFGVDVARFGDDKTEIYKRAGMKIVEHRELSKMDTQWIAKEVWQMANHDPSIRIKVDDTGLGGGVTDRLRELGAKVMAVNFGGNPADKKRYTSMADEMWFDFPVDEADIPDDRELLQELSGRLYDYDKHGRREIERKVVFKERLGRSPDRADGILLCYYDGGFIVDGKHKHAMKKRRR